MKKGPLHQSMAEAVVLNLEAEGCSAGGRGGEKSRAPVVTGEKKGSLVSFCLRFCCI
jgi:hypothetical protein